MFAKRLAISLLPVVIFTFSVGQAAEKCPDYKIPQGGNDNKKLETLLKNSWIDFMKDVPEWGYDLGYKELGDHWGDDSLEAIQARKNKADCLKKALGSIKRQGLSAENKVNYDIFSQEVDMRVEAKKFQTDYLVVDQLAGVHTNVVDTLLNMPQGNKQEVDFILKRLELIPQKIAQNKILLQEGLKKGITQPQVVLQKVPAQFDSILKDNVEESALFKPFTDLKALDEATKSEVRNQALHIIREKVYPAMQDLKNYLTSTYIPGARKDTSVETLPDGKAIYQWQIKHQTTTQKTAEEIHQLGLSEVARIEKEMEQIKNKTGFKKDLKAFNEFLLHDPKFYYTKAEDLLNGYRVIAKQMDPVLPQFFKTLPRLSYGVREMSSFKAPASPSAYYQPGSPALGRAGYFEANLYDLKARPKWAMEALTFHESVPGHHLQIALAQEMGELPDFRKYDGYTAFIEGWGLYSESLAEDMGFYQDPYSKYGQLTFEMWRAVRLVVDTGLHSKGWTRDQAIQYFMSHMPKSQLEAEVEVDRYIIWPGQALAYKIGQLNFLDLRRKAKEALQDKFDIREFHDALLSGGAMPLTILNTRMEHWIQDQKAKPAKKMM